MYPIVLSHFQTAPLLQARQRLQAAVQVSPDLGVSQVEVTLSDEGCTFPGGNLIPWDDIRRIAKSESKCFLVEGGSTREIRFYSEETDRVYTLFPTEGAPTMLLSGFTMHRIKRIDPWADTQNKIRAAAPAGRVLDTATGLGYTAIMAAHRADSVVTIELDRAALEVARLNPWSRDLFDNPKITQVVGDSFDEVKRFGNGSFDRIIHDPPVFSLGGHLYSLEFYGELYRVLAPRGRLFHYIGDLNSKSASTVSRGAIRRLHEVGFSRVTPRPEAYGVVAQK